VITVIGDLINQAAELLRRAHLRYSLSGHKAIKHAPDVI